jgi:hypothetical protein
MCSWCIRRFRQQGGNALVGANGEDGPMTLVVRWGGDQQQQLNNDNVIPLLELKAHASKTEGR